ncbi:hypothetical protein EJB05_49947, partial [Eragrostis curvula]
MAKSGDADGGDLDRISGLPDELLFSILLRVPHITETDIRHDNVHRILHCGLPHAADAARTSVLSRRWRRVWAHLSELHLLYDDVSAATLSRIDGALGAYAAPSLNHLRIEFTPKDPPLSTLTLDPPLSLHLRDTQPPQVPGHRISAWLRFASQRLTGSLRIEVPTWANCNTDDKGEHQVLLSLPEKIKSIDLSLMYHMLRLQTPFSGECTALVSLTIKHTHMDSDELEDVVSSRCPRLKELALVCVALHGTHQCLKLRSESLEKLKINLCEQPECKLIHVTAPNLRELITQFYVADAHISAPMLSEVTWYGHKYNPSRHQIAEAKSHLHRLEINSSCECEVMALMQRFHTVHELILNVAISQGTRAYKRFLSGISKLSRCEVLVVKVEHFYGMGHAFKPTLLSLLGKCAGVRKIVLHVNEYKGYLATYIWDLENHDDVRSTQLLRILVDNSQQYPPQINASKAFCSFVGTSSISRARARAYGLVTPAPPINGDAQAPNMYQQTPYRHVQESQSASNNRNVKAKDIGLEWHLHLFLQFLSVVTDSPGEERRLKLRFVSSDAWCVRCVPKIVRSD